MINQIVKLYLGKRIVTSGSIDYMFSRLINWNPLLDKIRNDFLKNPSRYLKDIEYCLATEDSKIDLNDCKKDDFALYNYKFIISNNEYKEILLNLKTSMMNMLNQSNKDSLFMPLDTQVNTIK